MKKLLSLLVVLLILVSTVGCSSESEKYDYSGRYALLTNPTQQQTFLLVIWDLPDDQIKVDSFELNTTNLNKYIDDSFTGEGEGISLNSLLGYLGFSRKFFNQQPININPAKISKVNKNIKISMDVVTNDGNTYKIQLEYDKSIPVTP